jgi:hypothetical protein
MEPPEITKIIEAEINGNWSLSNVHGVDLKKCLVPPVKEIYEDPSNNKNLIQLWLVLEEIPETHSGYEIVFDENRRKFGLAIIESGTKKKVFLGIYGSFLSTLGSM